jgi:phosphoserine phosphatase
MAKEDIIKEIRGRKRRMAICYDFDKTLSPDDMQAFTLIPSLKMDKKEFWNESNELAKENSMDKNLAWMYQLLTLSKAKRKSIKREYFKEVGKSIPLYKGVDKWFDYVNRYGLKNNIEVEHYIISSGLKEIIEGSVIADNFKRIYASSYLYSTDGVAEWPAQAINYTNKTQYIFRIAKGIFEEYDDRVNDSMSDSELYIPYENIVYIGDSATDIPCMRLVKSRGGYSIGVYDPEKQMKDNVYKLYGDGRLSFYTAADYSLKSELMTYMKTIIDEITAKENIKTEQLILNINSGIYKMMDSIQSLPVKYGKNIPKKEQSQISKWSADLRKMLEQ